MRDKKKHMELNLNSMASQRISTYAQHVFTEYAYSVNICRVVLSMYLQNTHMLVIRFDLVSQDMIFTLSIFERGNVYAHLGLKQKRNQ